MPNKNVTSVASDQTGVPDLHVDLGGATSFAPAVVVVNASGTVGWTEE